MNKKYYLAIALVALLVTTVGVTAIASADELGSQGDIGAKFREMKGNLPEQMRGNMQEMKTLMDNKDYTAWENLMLEKAVVMEERLNDFTAKINEDNFNNMLRLHELKQAGDFEGAKALEKELGLERPMNHNGKMLNKGFHKGMKGQEIE